MKPDPHLVWLAQRVQQLDAASPSGQARRAREQDLVERWADLEVGMPCRLTQQALNGAQGRDHPPLELREESTPCRILRIDVERDLALVLIECPPTATEWRGTLAQEVERSEILPVDLPPAAEQIAAPPPPPPIRRPQVPGPSRGRSLRRLPLVW
jgi:hypothetical protein